MPSGCGDANSNFYGLIQVGARYTGCVSDEALPAVQVADARQAALLLDVELRHVLLPMMKRACSATELARELGLGVQRAHYLIGRLQAGGVAERDSVQPRAGRPIKRYRVAPRWFIPFEVTDADTLESFLNAQILPRMQSLVRLSVRQLAADASDWGYWLEREGASSNLRMGDANGAATALFAGDEPFLLDIGTVWLSEAHATQLKRRLLAVLTEFSEFHDPESPPYTIGLQLARGTVF